MARKQPLPRYEPSCPLFGIDNGRGGFWTHEVFQTEEAAQLHMLSFWGSPEKVPREHKVIPVRVRIEDARPAPPDSR